MPRKSTPRGRGRPLKKTRLSPRNKAVLTYFRDVLEYNKKVRRTITRVKKIDEAKFRGHVRRYFQMQLIGLWQHQYEPYEIRGPYTGYSFVAKSVDWMQMLDECDSWVKGHIIKGTNWMLFKVIRITIREFARATRSGT